MVYVEEVEEIGRHCGAFCGDLGLVAARLATNVPALVPVNACVAGREDSGHSWIDREKPAPAA